MAEVTYLDAWFDHRAGNIHLWTQDLNTREDGYQVIPYSPCNYVVSDSPKAKFVDIRGRKMEKREYATNKEAVSHCSQNVHRTAGYFSPTQQWMMSHEGLLNYQDHKNFGSPQFRSCFIDIETYCNNQGGFSKPENPEGFIGSIGCWNNQDRKYTIFALNAGMTSEWKSVMMSPTKELIIYKSEAVMLQDFIRYFRKCKFNSIVGFNSRRFDITYIINRIKIIFGEDHRYVSALSPIRKVSWQEWNETYRIPGVVQHDYQEMYLKFTMGDVEETNLAHICMIEFGETKHESVYPMHCMDRNGVVTDYPKWMAMIKYQIQDVYLVIKLDEVKRFIRLGSSIYTRGMAEPEAIYSTIPYVDGAMACAILKKGMIPPSYKKWDDNEDQPEHKKYVGALTLDPKPGRKGWALMYDAKSMYPSAMRQVNISPETKVLAISGDLETKRRIAEVTRPYFDVSKTNLAEPIKIRMVNRDGTETEHDSTVGNLREFARVKKLTISGSGTYYTSEKKGVIPEILEGWFNERIQYQNTHTALVARQNAGEQGLADEIEWYEILSNAIKILLNSVYGAVGSKHSGYYDIDNAISTTMTAQNILRAAMWFADDWVRDKLNMVKSTTTQYEITNTKYPVNINYGDTDSIAVDMAKVVAKYGTVDHQVILPRLEADGAELGKHLSAGFKPWAKDHLNSDATGIIKFALEIISDTTIMIKAKKYVMRVIKDDKGRVFIGKNKLKVKGLEIVTATTPYKVKPVLKDMLIDIVNGDYKVCVDNIKLAREKFKSMSYQEMAKPSGIRGLKKWDKTTNLPNDINAPVEVGNIRWENRCPYHVKAALIYNYRTRNMQSTYKQIVDGNKIKLIYLKPNSHKFNVMAFESEFPTELGYQVDVDMQLEKVLMSMPRRFFSVLGWPFPQMRVEDLMGIFESFGVESAAVYEPVDEPDDEDYDHQDTGEECASYI
jgi:DNA polymerase elongation subunit (family B)